MKPPRVWQTAVWALVGMGVALVVAGLSAGAQGWSWQWTQQADLIWDIRAPRTLGAWSAGALLALAGLVAQGLFRNPLADPYLLGSAAGAGLGVVLVLAAATGWGALAWTLVPSWSLGASLSLAAFAGALMGVGMSWVLSGGAARPTVLLLSGVVVSVLLTAVSDLIITLYPQALRARQHFLLGSTHLLDWQAVGWMSATWACLLAWAWRKGRVLDALVLGEDTARSLGIPLGVQRVQLLGILAVATGVAVAQCGLIAFVGLVAPHVARRLARTTHAPLMVLTSLTGGALLLSADVAARSVMAPAELPVGILTALLGGMYLLILLRRRYGN